MLVAAKQQQGYFLAGTWGCFITMMRLLFIYSSNGHIRGKKSLQICWVWPREGQWESRVCPLLKMLLSVLYGITGWYWKWMTWKSIFTVEWKMNEPGIRCVNSLCSPKHRSTCSELWRSLSEGEGHCTPLGSGHVDRELPPWAPLIPDSKAAHTKEQTVCEPVCLYNTQHVSNR